MVALLACLLLALPAWAQVYCGTQRAKECPAPRALPVAKTRAIQQPAQIGVGTSLDFYSSFNLSLVPATCRFVGEHSYIFVEDAQWGASVAQAEVDTLGALFEERTPADPQRGIYPLATETFGEPPDVDGDPRVFILILEIPEEGVVGFFDSHIEEIPLPEYRRETIYLDAPALRRQPYLAHGTLAHELQHLIHWGHDSDEDRWVDEGLAGYAEEVAGYPEADPEAVPAFLKNPAAGLLWPSSSLDVQAHNYGGTYLFMSCLAQRQGRDFIRQLVAQPRNGTFGVDEAFKSQGLTGGFLSAWGGWVAGNYASADSRYGYAALKGRRVRVQPLRDLPVEEIEGQVGGRWGAQYISFPEAGNIEIGFSSESPFLAWAYAWQGGQGQLQEVGVDELGRGTLVAQGVDSLVVIAGRTGAQGRSYLISANYFIPTLAEGPEALPLGLALGAAYPNPFNSETQIPFALPEAAEVELAVYNALGQRLRLLQVGQAPSGAYQARWDGRDERGALAGSGTYTVVLQAGPARLSRRLSLVK
jgi:hypothetical protein